MAVRVTVQIINPWKIISTSANDSVDIIIFLGLIICTVTLTAMCFLHVYNNMRNYRRKIGLPCLIGIHENDIFPVKLPTVR